MKRSETVDKIAFVFCWVGAFAERFKLPDAEAYAFMKRFSAIDFLIDCYAAEHTFSVDDAVEDVIVICQRNGGIIVAKNRQIDDAIRFRIEDLATELAAMLTEKYGWDVKRAVDELYSSRTYGKLSDPACKLYCESAAFVYGLLQEEMDKKLSGEAS